MLKMGGLGGMDNFMGVSVNFNFLFSIIVVINFKLLFFMYLFELDLLFLNKFIDFWRFYFFCLSLVLRKSLLFFLLVLINYLLMVILKFYFVGVYYEIGGLLFLS